MTKTKNSVGAVLTFYDKGSYGAVSGADGQGHYAVIFYGAPLDAEAAAYKYVEERRKMRGGRSRISEVCVVMAMERFAGMPISIIDV